MEENKQEKATEIDVRLEFERLFKPIEALQKLLIAEANRLSDDGVDATRFSIEVNKNQIIIRVGSIVLYHEVRISVFDLDNPLPNTGA